MGVFYCSMYGELYVRAESREQLAQYLAAWLLAVRRALERCRRPVSPAVPAPGAAIDLVPLPHRLNSSSRTAQWSAEHGHSGAVRLITTATDSGIFHR